MLIAFTETLESAAPLGSFTVPTKPPVSTCANPIAVALIRRTTRMKVFLIEETPLCPHDFAPLLIALPLCARPSTPLQGVIETSVHQKQNPSLRYLSKLFRFISFW